MAIVTFGAGAKELRGKMGGVVFRRLYGQNVASRVPDFSRRQLSAAQQAHCQRFKTAAQQARLALADPVRRAAYAALALEQHRPLIAVAISDCYQKQNPEMLKTEMLKSETGAC